MNFEKLIDFGLGQGAQEIEIYLQQIKSDQIQIFKGEVESLLSSKGQGIGVRAFIDGRMGFAYTSNFNDEGLKKVISEAIANAGLMGDTTEKRKLPELFSQYPEVDIYDPGLFDIEIDEKINLAVAIEKAALDYDPRIVMVPSVTYQDKDIEIHLINSKGLNLKYRKTQVVAYLFALAREDGHNQTGIGIGFGKGFSDLNPEIIGEKAAKEAISMLGGKPVPSQEVPVLFNSYSGSMIFYPFVPGFLAEKVQKGKSLFKGKLGREIANPLVTLIDDGLKKEGLMTAPFDDEGIPSKETVVVENGVLKNYLYDSHTARIDGVISTGNSRRKSYRDFPEASPTNFYLKPGNDSLEEMIAGIEEGFLVLQLSGVHSGANPISGDFSIGASGIWIKDGKLAQPVRKVTIAGNFSQLLKDIIKIGNDLTFNPLTGFMGTPSFLVRKLAVSGT
ncbi:hypothetical protein BBF96_10240 [Anoxybacter fermentans]|uniref:Peptidase C69 n=1 Tax=Anoxybacter fermentans TaxID=1323375 RepID=A0A3S9SZQ3_9FIRM|nr:TldD/PmbA family protein [Anoxybacter fermentans]AZR73730.1 hypothetical protein BBF96_10240 [Anoxybacter fermentans]